MRFMTNPDETAAAAHKRGLLRREQEDSLDEALEMEIDDDRMNELVGEATPSSPAAISRNCSASSTNSSACRTGSSPTSSKFW